MLFLISSAPDTKEFKTAYHLAKNLNAEICLMQSAVYASRDLNDQSLYVLRDDLQLRGITEDETSSKIIDYDELIELMLNTDKVIGLL